MDLDHSLPPTRLYRMKNNVQLISVLPEVVQHNNNFEVAITLLASFVTSRSHNKVTIPINLGTIADSGHYNRN